MPQGDHCHVKCVPLKNFYYSAALIILGINSSYSKFLVIFCCIFGKICQILRFLIKITWFFSFSSKNDAESLCHFVKIPFLDLKRAKLDQKSWFGHVRTCQDLFSYINLSYFYGIKRRSGHDWSQRFGPIWHVSGPKMVFWRNDTMILHHFCWRSWKIKLF